MNVFVAGASGAIGRRLTPLLLGAGHVVYGLTVLRFGSLYGPGTWFDEPVGTFPVHVDAAAWATLLAVERGALGVFNVAEEGGYADSARARKALGWHPGLRV